MTARPASSGVSMDVLSLLRLIVRHWRVTAPAALLTVLGLVAAFRSRPPRTRPRARSCSWAHPKPLTSPTQSRAGAAARRRPEPVCPLRRPLRRGRHPRSRHGQRLEARRVRVAGRDRLRRRRQPLPAWPCRRRDGEGFEPRSGHPIGGGRARGGRRRPVASSRRPRVLTPITSSHSAPLEPPSTATAMYGSTVRTAIAALALGALGTLGLAVLAEAIARRRAARPTAAAGPATSDAASNGSRKTGCGHRRGGASNGSGTGASTGAVIGSAPSQSGRAARQEPAEQEVDATGAGRRRAAEQEPSTQEPVGAGAVAGAGGRKTTQQERSRQESAWKKAARTFDRSHPASLQLTMDTGGRRPTGARERYHGQSLWHRADQREPDRTWSP